MLVLFFFKQKTAYEMRISDWSSDVCSSDLLLRAFAGALAEVKPAQTSDTAIRDSIIAEMNKETWAPTASVNVIVRDGTVHLWGSIFQESQRAALKAMAAATPGVKDVQDHLIWLEPMSGLALEAPKAE